ncbi:MAG: GNAT family N-acetyltransferase [Erysipelotrichales bacterium]|nr:GNAT family N-acetyltransferase [Erysipelotrichales bacterium]
MIRKATMEDLGRTAEIYSEIHLEEECGKVTIGWERDVYPTYDTAKAAWQRGELFVMEENAMIVGAAVINQTQVDVYKDARWEYEAEDHEVMVLHTLVISPKVKGRGYGTEFVRFYEQYAWENGCKYLRIDTNVRNTIARTMYNKLGYKEIDIVPCIFNGIEGVDLVLIEKYLGNIVR